jgi:hypothetical protein
MRGLVTIAIVGAFGLLVGGCQPGETYGYVQIKRMFSPGPNDTFRLNGMALDDLKRGASVIIKQRSGATRLELDRGGAVATLCAFDVGKNRIVTATINVENGRIKCGVQT